jgi:pimeloyl-ACP methyl ester carboxylesterase
MRALTVVGHSLGGWLALALALDAPERIAEVVLVDAVPAFAALAMPRATAEQIEAVVAEREALGLARGERLAELVAQALAPMITDARDRSAVIGEAVRSDGPTLVRVMSELWRSDLRSELSHVKASVTVAVPLPLDLEPTRRAARLDLYRAQLTGLPASRIEIVEPSRHFIMLDQPSRFFRIVDDALRRAHRR